MEDEVIITKGRTASIYIFTETDFNSATLMGNSSIELNPIIPDESPNEVILYVEFSSILESLSDDFKLEAAIAISFRLTPKISIKAIDLFKCIELTNEHLQNVLNATFSEHQIPTVPPIQIDDVSDILDEHIQNLQK